MAFLNLGLPIVDLDSSKCPLAWKLVLREQFRDVFKRRRAFRTYTLSNVGIDACLDKWYENKHSLLRAFSIRPEWDWASLSLHFDENVMRPVNFYKAKRDYLCLLARPNYLDRSEFVDWSYNTVVPCHYRAASEYYLGHFHEILYGAFVFLFNYVILEGNDVSQDSVFTEKDAKVSADRVQVIQEYISLNLDLVDNRPSFSKGLCEKLGINYVPFNKLPKAIFDYASSHLNDYFNLFNELEDYFNSNSFHFIAEILKSIGAHQLANGVGPVKTTITNKLIKTYYDWLTALSIGFSGNHFVIEGQQPFEFYVNRMKNDYRFYTDEQFKIRDDSNGFRFVDSGSFEQLFARLQEYCRGSMTRESFIVSLHPVDMITCSLGYNWSSCQSWIDVFTDFPDRYGSGSNYQGMYNRGNFQFLCGNGFIAYVPYEKLPGVPQYYWAKQKRCLLWMNNELNCMRQNYFYPGRPEDEESKAFAKVIREYIQNVVAPFNFSNGTIDWKSCSRRVSRLSALDDTDFTRFTEQATYNSGRYDDPILTVSYLKGTENGKLIYAEDFPTFDTGRFGNSFFKRTTHVCPVCGKQHSSDGLCDHCRKELIEHNGQMVHPSNLLKIKVDGKDEYLDVSEFDKLSEFVKVEDGTHVPFKSAFKVFMPSGIKYFKELPDYVKECKVCHEYFHPSFMVGDVCVDHINAVLDDNLDIDIDFDVVLDSFIHSSLSFACNDIDALQRLLVILDDKDVKWINGLNPSGFIPSSTASRGRFLSCVNGKLVLSSQPKSSVVKLSKLFEKGGE